MANDKTNASDKIAEFQKQAREVLRAQQEAYLSAVKTWREGLRQGRATAAVAHQRACRHAAASERSGGGILRIRREVARRPEPLHGRVEQGDRSAPEEGLKSSSVQNPGRPWLELYRDVPAAIEPPSRTALDMFRATAVGGRDSSAGSVFRSTYHGRPMRRHVRRARCGAAEARRRVRRSHRGLHAKRPAGLDLGVGRVEVRRRGSAVQSDAA